MNYYNQSYTGIAERIIYRGIQLKAKRASKCFISGKDINIGDDILWLPKTQYTALTVEAEAAKDRMSQEDADLRTMGY